MKKNIGAPLIDDAKISIECEMDGNYELEEGECYAS